jgi:DNA polymerase-4
MILHVDMDAFYASVEEREHPELMGKPLIVGGTPEGRGVVAAANYVVRKFGVHSAMPTSRALRLCPDAIVLRPRMDFYAAVSEQIREIMHRYSPLVEPLSLDEAFIDVTGSEQLFGPAPQIGRRIKREILESLRLVASVGVAPNKFLAKIASDIEKPDGFVVVGPQHVQDFLDPLPVSRLWGVGRVTGQSMEQLGIRTISQVRAMSVEILKGHFGAVGEHLWQLAHGIDDRRVVPDREAKSISHETTFAEDIDDCDVLRAWLVELAEQVARRLRRHNLRGRTVQLKIRFADFRTITRSKTVSQPTDITDEISRVAVELLENCSAARGQRLRLVGVGMTGFDWIGSEGARKVQQSLFADEQRAKHAHLDEATDCIRERFGIGALHRGSGLLYDARHKPMPRPTLGQPPDDRPG